MTKPKTTNEHIAAMILSGGLSSRMGKDKAILHPYGEQEPNLLKRTHNILSNHFNTIWVSCAKNKQRRGYTCIFDEFHEIGPISGIYAGLKMAKKQGFEAILVLPCDLPLISSNIIKILLQARATHRKHCQNPYNLMTTFSHEETKNIEALIAIYEVEALSLFEKCIKNNIRAPRKVIPEDLRTLISYHTNLSQFFFNLNTADEFVEFQKLHKNPKGFSEQSDIG